MVRGKPCLEPQSLNQEYVMRYEEAKYINHQREVLLSYNHDTNNPAGNSHQKQEP